ncbi:branched-chain amino acid aminotransferase [Cohnella rhizosphaerae]|uniref:branched-chain amino acid aminotransferase n=1 Tax=Cohnella rhizosphaerae TaxID=1457232 RepID=UPI003B8A5CE0
MERNGMDRSARDGMSMNGIRELQRQKPPARKKRKGRTPSRNEAGVGCASGNGTASAIGDIATTAAADALPPPPSQAASKLRELLASRGGLGFGQYFSDHMLLMDFEEGAGWGGPRIVPYGPLTIDPAAKVFHYGQTVFEGMKAFKWRDGGIRLFRPRDHVRRLNRSCARMCVPGIEEARLLGALQRLVAADADWVPDAPGTSLYIRPFVVATETRLGVAPSRSYRFVAICSPVGAYYAEGVRPVPIYVETAHVRAVPGGVGDAKTAGNYAAGLQAQEAASRLGCAQVLWLDGVERQYVEEVGSMNAFFRFGDEVVTPPLGGSILAGVTRDSALRLLRDWGVSVRERPIAIGGGGGGLAGRHAARGVRHGHRRGRLSDRQLALARGTANRRRRGSPASCQSGCTRH